MRPSLGRAEDRVSLRTGSAPVSLECCAEVSGCSRRGARWRRGHRAIPRDHRRARRRGEHSDRQLAASPADGSRTIGTPIVPLLPGGDQWHSSSGMQTEIEWDIVVPPAAHTRPLRRSAHRDAVSVHSSGSRVQYNIAHLISRRSSIFTTGNHRNPIPDAARRHGALCPPGISTANPASRAILQL